MSDAFKQILITPTVKHRGGNVMVWGSFNDTQVGNLTIIDERLTAAKYIELLNENLFQSIEKFRVDRTYVFQHDNDPKHTTKIVNKFIDENGTSVLPWPPQSMDLNPTEHLWDELERQIPKTQRYTKSKFITAIESKWNEITADTLKKLINSMPRRLLEVIKVKGYQTSY